MGPGRRLADEGVTPEQFEALTRRARLPALRALARRLVREVPSNARVLDVGCGPGWFLALLAETEPGLALTGADPDEGCLRVAERVLSQRGASAGLHAAPAEALPFPDGAFDAVACLWTLHHIEKPAGALAEMARVLAPGGKLLLVDFRPEGFFVAIAKALLALRAATAGSPEARAMRASIQESRPLEAALAALRETPLALVRARRTGLGWRVWAAKA